jgi:chromosome segregation ATPase
MNVRVKALKRQLDEAEEEVQREKVGKRKAQRELEDMLETHETITRECNNLRNKLRYASRHDRLFYIDNQILNSPKGSAEGDETSLEGNGL